MLVHVRSQRKTEIKCSSCAKRGPETRVGRGEAHLRKVVSYGVTSPRGEIDRFGVGGDIRLPPPVRQYSSADYRVRTFDLTASTMSRKSVLQPESKLQQDHCHTVLYLRTQRCLQCTVVM